MILHREAVPFLYNYKIVLTDSGIMLHSITHCGDDDDVSVSIANSMVLPAEGHFQSCCSGKAASCPVAVLQLTTRWKHRTVKQNHSRAPLRELQIYEVLGLTGYFHPSIQKIVGGNFFFFF